MNVDLELPTQPISATDRIPKLATELEVPDRVRRRAVELAQQASEAGLTIGRRPSGIAAGVCISPLSELDCVSHSIRSPILQEHRRIHFETDGTSYSSSTPDLIGKNRIVSARSDIFIQRRRWVAKTFEDAREDMDALRQYIHRLAAELH